MNDAIQNLLSLQSLEFGEVTGKNVESQIAELRAKIPAPILGHYDRLRIRDKKGLAAIRNQVCTGCHMRVPIGQITVIMRGADIQLCETCGRYSLPRARGRSSRRFGACCRRSCGSHETSQSPAQAQSKAPRRSRLDTAAVTEPRPAAAKVRSNVD